MPTVAQSEIPPPKSWDEFEDIVADLYTRIWNDPSAARYGRSGQPQQGVDIYGQPGRPEGGYVGIQCKRYAVGTLNRRIVEEEIAKAEDFRPALAKYIIATTDRRDAKLQRAVRAIDKERRAAGKFPIQVMFWEDLCSQLAHPDNRGLLKKHYPELFGGLREPIIPIQLPQRAEHFTGREDEVVHLMAALKPGFALTLCGPGGIGKTALAAEALWSLAERDEDGLTNRFPDGVIFHDFYIQSQAAVALESIVRTYREEPSPSPAAAARRVLAGRQALLILDGAENADDLPAVLAVRGSCGLLITTRRRRDAVGDFIDLTALDIPKAVEVLQAWGGARAADDTATRRICALIGGLPLAVRLVGRYLAQRGENATDYLTWLEKTPLAALHHGERQLESVPVLLDQSVAQVGEDARRALATLGLLALTPFGREPIATALECSSAEAGRHLGELVDYGLLQRKSGEKGRYHASHALIHIYAQQRGHDLGLPSDALVRLANYYADLAREQTGFGPAGYAVLDEERNHLLTVLDRCAVHQRWDPACALARGMDAYLDICGHWTDRVAALEIGLAAARTIENELEEGRFLGEIGGAHYQLSEWDRAIEMYQQSLDIKEREGDAHGVAGTYNNLGVVYMGKGEWDRAIEMYVQSFETFERLGDFHGMAQTYNNLGNVYHRRGDWDRAIEYYQKELEISELLGDVHGMARSYSNLAIVYRYKGEWDRAIETYHQGVEIFEHLGYIHALAKSWVGLGLVYADKGEWDRAIEMYKQSLGTFEHIGDAHGMAQTYNNLAIVYQNKGEWDRAIEYYQKDLEISERVGDVHGMAVTWQNLGLVYADKGEWGQSIKMYKQSLRTFEHMGDAHGMAQTWGNLATVYATMGEWDRAIEMYRQSLQTFERVGDICGIAQSWLNLGNVYTIKGELDQAIEIYHQSLQTKEHVGDVHGMAQIWGNLGNLYAEKGEWDQAIDMHQKSLEIFERLGDVHGMAQMCTNLGLVYLRLDQFDGAKPLLARAYRLFSQLALPHADLAAQRLVEACGSLEAANAYLGQLAEESKPGE